LERIAQVQQMELPKVTLRVPRADVLKLLEHILHLRCPDRRATWPKLALNPGLLGAFGSGRSRILKLLSLIGYRH
jgi:hypothetical protein